MLRQVTVCEESLIDCMIDCFFFFDEFVVYMYVWGHMHLSTARNLWLMCIVLYS